MPLQSLQERLQERQPASPVVEAGGKQVVYSLLHLSEHCRLALLSFYSICLQELTTGDAMDSLTSYAATKISKAVIAGWQQAYDERRRQLGSKCMTIMQYLRERSLPSPLRTEETYRYVRDSGRQHFYTETGEPGTWRSAKAAPKKHPRLH